MRMSKMTFINNVMRNNVDDCFVGLSYSCLGTLYEYMWSIGFDLSKENFQQCYDFTKSWSTVSMGQIIDLIPELSDMFPNYFEKYPTEQEVFDIDNAIRGYFRNKSFPILQDDSTHFYIVSNSFIRWRRYIQADGLDII
jgi:hypothetical protein